MAQASRTEQTKLRRALAAGVRWMLGLTIAGVVSAGVRAEVPTSSPAGAASSNSAARATATTTAPAGTPAAGPSTWGAESSRPRAAVSRRILGQIDAEVRRDVVFARVDGHDLKLDLAVPRAGGDGPADAGRAQAGRRVPLVIWIHGGGWQGGSKEGSPAVFLLREGFAVASISYRLTDVATFPAQIHDCKAAVRFLRANAEQYGIDPQHIGVWGASAGGHLAALLGVTGDDAQFEGKVGEHLDVSSRVQAVCDWFGPTIFDAKNVPLAFGGNPMVVKLLGGTIDQKRELARMASPALHVTGDAAPFLIVHGDKDNLVPLFQSTIMAQWLEQAGVESKLVVLPNAGHGGPPFVEAARRDEIVAFFSKHLKAGAIAATAPAATH